MTTAPNPGSHDTGWRGDYPVLVPEAGASGMIAVIRSLGRAGYPVHACATDPHALGLRSRFAKRGVISPPYDDPVFLSWLEEYVAREGIRVIVPSEGFLVAARPAFERLAPLMPVPADEGLVYRCMSKCDTFASFLAAQAPAAVRERIPPTLVVERDGPRPAAGDLEALGHPLYLKTDACHGEPPGTASVHRETDPVTALRRLDALLGTHRRVLCQGPAAGRKATVNVCLHRGELLAESMCLSTHENPHTGGLTTLRHLWWHQGMRDDALARLRHLGWDGVAMVEYKWDAARGEYTFIELNARYWAALHLDLFAGLDFPRIQIDSFLGRPARAPKRYPLGLTARYTIPADFGYALSRIRDPGTAWPARIWTALEFALLFAHPRIRSDLLFPGDRRLYWLRWRQFLADIARR